MLHLLQIDTKIEGIATYMLTSRVIENVSDDNVTLEKRCVEVAIIGLQHFRVTSAYSIGT